MLTKVIAFDIKGFGYKQILLKNWNHYIKFCIAWVIQLLCYLFARFNWGRLGSNLKIIETQNLFFGGDIQNKIQPVY